MNTPMLVGRATVAGVWLYQGAGKTEALGDRALIWGGIAIGPVEARP